MQGLHQGQGAPEVRLGRLELIQHPQRLGCPMAVLFEHSDKLLLTQDQPFGFRNKPLGNL